MRKDNWQKAKYTRKEKCLGKRSELYLENKPLVKGTQIDYMPLWMLDKSFWRATVNWTWNEGHARRIKEKICVENKSRGDPWNRIGGKELMKQGQGSPKQRDSTQISNPSWRCATYQENWKSVYERFHIVSHGEEAINKKKSLMIENKGHLESEIQNTKAKQYTYSIRKSADFKGKIFNHFFSSISTR